MNSCKANGILIALYSSQLCAYGSSSGVGSEESQLNASLSATLGSECSGISGGSLGDLEVSSSPVSSGVWGPCISSSIDSIRPFASTTWGHGVCEVRCRVRNRVFFSIRENRWFAEEIKIRSFTVLEVIKIILYDSSLGQSHNLFMWYIP